MQINSPSSSRAAWYDRNPAAKVQVYVGSSVAPHAQTTRTTYTVPSGSKAILESMMLHSYRNTAATTVREYQVHGTITPSGGTEGFIIFIDTEDNSVGAEYQQFALSTISMFAGDEITTTTEDDSSGGTVTYITSQKVTQFDA